MLKHLTILALISLLLPLSACGDDHPLQAQAAPAPAANSGEAKPDSQEAAKDDSAKSEEAERKKSKNPPVGAPWTKDFAEAHSRAFLSGKPIFVYSTKTY